MYNQSYEDYMRNVLGYSFDRNNLDSTYQTYDNYMPYFDRNMIQNNSELERMYPDIYRIVYPMVCKTCDMYSNQPITEELIEEMTTKIYLNIETNENTTVNVKVESRNGDVKNHNEKKLEERENREDRVDNFLLRDLIRILLLRELLGRFPGRPPMRPPFPGRPPMRPPFPGRPGQRDYDDYVRF